VSEASGIRKHIGKGMGIAVADFDGDGWTDIFLANDTVPAFLFHNNGNGAFSEIGVQAGVAYTERGLAVSGMGADARDLDNDGLPDIFETAMIGETMPFFRNLGNNLFEDKTLVSTLAATTISKTGWSNGIFDFNNDGWKDLFAAFGDVMDPQGTFQDRVPQANGIFVNMRNGKFADATPTAGPISARKAVHRGSAFGDINNDGRIDVVVTSLDGPIEIWKNVSPSHNYWILINTVGSKSNRDGMATKFKVVTASGTQYNHVNTAVGYGCASDKRLHFGLGKDTLIKEMTVTWPSGTVQKLENIKPDQILTLREP
jgi:enediyne biosynthesis protein E4